MINLFLNFLSEYFYAAISECIEIQKYSYLQLSSILHAVLSVDCSPDYGEWNL